MYQTAKIILTLGAFTILLLCSTFYKFAFADGNEQLGISLPVYTGKYDVGVTSLGSLGLRGEATTLMKIPEEAQIIAAYIYLSGYSNLTASQLTPIRVTFTNDLGDVVNATGTVIGISSESQFQCFTYRAEVTEAVIIGEHRYRVQSKELPVVRPTSGHLYGGGLLVIYSLPNLPESNIWIADGLDYFAANNGYPTTKTVCFPFDGNRFERYGSVKIFAGVDNTNAASGVWYKLGHGSLPDNIMDEPEAIDYNKSSSADPNVDTNPLTDGVGIRRGGWSMVEYLIPVQSEQEWAAFQLESQIDHPNLPALSGVWNVVAFKLPFEETGCGSIGDRIFYDKNSNGIRDAMETPIPTVKVSLYRDDGDANFDPAVDQLVDTTRTNRLGFYLFQNLQFGTYFVDIGHPDMNNPSIILTTQNDPTPPIVLENCDAIMDVDFGFMIDGRNPIISVELDSFIINTNIDKIVLNWTTRAETENLGFDIYRSEHETGGYQLLNEEVIPTLASNTTTHEYSFEDTDVEAGDTYYYKLADVDISGNTTMFGPVSATVQGTEVAKNSTEIKKPMDYKLGAAYPNPFNGKTTIHFYMKEPGMVRIDIFDMLGRKIRTLVSEIKNAGLHAVAWNGQDNFGLPVSSGIYLYKMTTGNFNDSRRMLYLK